MFKKVNIESKVLDFIIADAEIMNAESIKEASEWVEELYDMYKVLMRIWRTQEPDTWARYMTWNHLQDNSTYKILDNEIQHIVKKLSSRSRPDLFKVTKRPKVKKVPRGNRQAKTTQRSRPDTKDNRPR